MKKLNQEEVIDLEQKVIDLAKELGAGSELEVGVHRNYAGTLHVNLLFLARTADALATQLERRYGLQRETRN